MTATSPLLGSRQPACAPTTKHRVLVVSSIFPSQAQPNYGVFVKERLRAVAALGKYDLRVVAPTPWFPKLPVRTRWAHWAHFPQHEWVDGFAVGRPRYWMVPKIGGYFEADLMCPAVEREVEKLVASGFAFELVDAHFVYPNGVVGSWLAEKYRVPLVMTGRGTEMVSFPNLPIMGQRIRSAIPRCSEFIALSREIAEAFERLGAPRDRITVIPNGVDCEKFRPIAQAFAREQLGLPADRRILLSVGNRLENKGFHLLIEALPRIRERFPEAMVVIVGGRTPYGADFTPVIDAAVRRHGLEQHVRLVGSWPHEELAVWYSAADLFVLLSSREGSPNVLMETLACGTPAVATPVGGIPEMLRDERLGIVLPERSVPAAAEGIIEALGRDWDRGAIRQIMEQRDWSVTARAVAAVFERALQSRGS
jgi:teichuronic acid biosynthesis glycosyltransferase TuaC